MGKSLPKALTRKPAFAWLLIAPVAAYLCLIVVWPLLETVQLSFTDANIGGESYVGTANYENLANSSKFTKTIGCTFCWMLIPVSLNRGR